MGVALVIWWFYGPRARVVAHLGATYPASGMGARRAFAVEVAVTFLLLFVIVVVARDAAPRSISPALAIGVTLTAVIVISGPISGGGATRPAPSGR